MGEPVKSFVSLIPIALLLVAFGAAVWFLLPRNSGIARWLIAAFVFGHGFAHAMFAFPRPAGSGADYPYDLGQSWFVTGAGVDVGIVRVIGIALVIAVVLGFALSALSALGIVVPTAWWPALVVGSSAASAILLVVGFNPVLVLGFGIDAVLVWVVVSSAWVPATTSALG